MEQNLSCCRNSQTLVHEEPEDEYSSDPSTSVTAGNSKTVRVSRGSS